jgi:arsenate reductase
MAQAFYEARGGEARSAGTRPERRVHAPVAEAMRERGLDVGGRTPHKLSREDVEWAALVVTMGCGDECPVIPGKRYVAWELTDPAGKDLSTVRGIRDEVERLVGELPL